MFRVDIKNQGKCLFGTIQIVPGNIACFFHKSLMADRSDLETVNHRLFFQAILLIRRQRHKKNSLPNRLANSLWVQRWPASSFFHAQRLISQPVASSGFHRRSPDPGLPDKCHLFSKPSPSMDSKTFEYSARPIISIAFSLFIWRNF